MSSRINGILTGALVLLCVGAAGVLTFEILHPPQLRSPGGPPGQPVQQSDSEPFTGFNIAPLSQYGEIVERPLFLTNRRPPEETPLEAPPAAEPPKEEQQLTLLGVVLTPEATMALVQDDKTGKVSRLRVGERINLWQLQAVQADRVSLSSGETVLELPLERNKKPPSGNNPQQIRKRLQTANAPRGMPPRVVPQPKSAQ